MTVVLANCAASKYRGSYGKESSVRAGGPWLVYSLVKDGQQIQLVTFHQLLKLLTSFLSFTLLFHPP